MEGDQRGGGVSSQARGGGSEEEIFDVLGGFLAEQSLQLYLRSLLLELVGDYPRTRSVRLLLRELNRVLGSRELEEFAAANRARPIALEDAYLMSRYYVREYEREDAEDMVSLVEELLALLRRVRGAGR